MIRRRPTFRCSDSNNRIQRGLIALGLVLCLSLSLGLVGASTAYAQDAADESAAESPASTGGMPTGEEILTGMAKAQDALLIRPLATIRVILGAAFMIPAAVLSSPSGMEGIQAAYDALIDQPVEYAFRRPLGDFDY